MLCSWRWRGHNHNTLAYICDISLQSSPLAKSKETGHLWPDINLVIVRLIIVRVKICRSVIVQCIAASLSLSMRSFQLFRTQQEQSSFSNFFQLPIYCQEMFKLAHEIQSTYDLKKPILIELNFSHNKVNSLNITPFSNNITFFLHNMT